MNDKLKDIDRYAVVFSGGGALGAWEVGAYEYLVNAIGKKPATIVGTSAGSLNCAAILAGHDIPKMKKLWAVKWWEVFHVRLRTIVVTLFPTALAVLIIRFLFKNSYRSVFDTGPLRKKIDEVLVNYKLSQPRDVDFVITLTDIVRMRKEAHCIMNKDRFPDEDKFTTKYLPIESEKMLAESLIGTSAIPIVFPPNQQYYFDGGILNNNPLSVAWQLKEKMIFVLIPSATVDTSDSSGPPINNGLLDIVSHLMDTWISLNLKEVVHAVKSVNKNEDYRVKVCIIRPNADFARLGVGLLSFGKNLDALIANGNVSAELRLCKFDLQNMDTWF